MYQGKRLPSSTPSRVAPSSKPYRYPAKKRFGLWSLLLLLLSVVCFCCFLREYRSYSRTLNYYQSLSENVVIRARPKLSPAQRGSALDFKPLLTQNKDTVAWLEIPGLSLSLPITWCGDNDTYLHTSFDGTDSRSGCLFLDAKASPDFSRPYQLIYGHNMKNGSMFGQLSAYAEKAFWKENPSFTLYTPQGDYTCQVFSCHSTEDGSEIYRMDWSPDADFTAFLQRLQQAALYDTGVKVDQNSQILTLSTCNSSYAGGLSRFVVHCVMTPLSPT